MQLFASTGNLGKKRGEKGKEGRGGKKKRKGICDRILEDTDRDFIDKDSSNL